MQEDLLDGLTESEVGESTVAICVYAGEPVSPVAAQPRKWKPQNKSD